MKQKLYFLALALFIQFQFFGQTPASHLNFDGVDDSVTLGTTTTTALNNSNFVTAEAWINIPNTTGTKTIVGNHINNGAQFNLLVNNDILQGFIGFGTYYVTSAAGAITANTWLHVALVYNDTTLKLFINGVEVGSTVIPVAYSLPTSSLQYLIGSSGYPSENLSGNIDDVRIWNTARTSAQLSGSRFCELQGTESGLLTYYKFNQGLNAVANPTVTTLINAVSGGANGTLTNFALTGATSNWLAGSPVTTGSIVPSAPTITTPVVYVQGTTATALTATTGGAGLLWYTVAMGGSGSTTAPTPSTATVGSTSYWVSSTNANGCESARVQMVVTVNAPLPATHLNFDGVNDYVSNTITNLPLGNTARTIQAWVKTTQNTGGGAIMTYGNLTSNNRFALYQSGGKLNFVAELNDYNTNATINDGVWHHIAATHDGTSLKVYLDGVQVGTTQAKTFATTGSQLSIGYRGVSGEFFRGDIDEVRIWDRALTAAEIVATKDCELQASQTGIVSYFKFNQGLDATSNSAVTSLSNSISGGANGTLTNFALTGSTSNWLAGSPVTTGTICTTLSKIC